MKEGKCGSRECVSLTGEKVEKRKNNMTWHRMVAGMIKKKKNTVPANWLDIDYKGNERQVSKMTLRFLGF